MISVSTLFSKETLTRPRRPFTPDDRVLNRFLGRIRKDPEEIRIAHVGYDGDVARVFLGNDGLDLVEKGGHHADFGELKKEISGLFGLIGPVTCVHRCWISVLARCIQKFVACRRVEGVLDFWRKGMTCGLT